MGVDTDRYRDPEKRKAYLRNYQRTFYKKGVKKETTRAEFDNYSYRLVPSNWRSLVQQKEKYVTPEVTSPIVKDLMRGKTVLVDYTLPHGAYNNHPFRTLYSYFSTRGYRLRVHVVDRVDKDEYRKLLLWAEPIKTVKYVEPEKESAA